ncbi:hypothetical protein E2542_SST08871 [Spatholobus suberectus]|nr:hypothetical protein E2542_SST08871 [Spatholobus suberectus]
MTSSIKREDQGRSVNSDLPNEVSIKGCDEGIDVVVDDDVICSVTILGGEGGKKEWGAMEWEDECRTPRLVQNQIPAVFICPPPPPRKKPVAGKRRPPPKEGYFHPPDLDSLFSVPARKEACV